MDILQRILQFTTQPVAHEVPEFGTVHLRRLTLGELDQMQEEQKRVPPVGESPLPPTVRLLARFLGDEKGAAVFDLGNPEHKRVLLSMPVGVAADILRAGTKVNNMTEEAEIKNV